jgi:TRAP-type C4-dicarboxylate transport system permease small subunit
VGIGVSILLIAVGLILAIAVKGSAIDFIDINVVGWILVVCGVLGLLVTLLIFAPRRRATQTPQAAPYVRDDRPQY